MPRNLSCTLIKLLGLEKNVREIYKQWLWKFEKKKFVETQDASRHNMYGQKKQKCKTS